MTIEEAIASYEKSAERYHKAFLHCKAHGGEFYNEEAESNKICYEHDCQLAEWLKELKERRKERDYWQEKANSYEQTIFKLTDAISKQPEIVRCKDCKHYEWMSNRIPEEQTWHCHCWDADTGKDDFCSYAERKTDEQHG